MGVRVLVVPDAYYTFHSGAKACRKLCFYLKQLSEKVGVFASGVKENGVNLDPEVEIYSRTPFSGYQHVINKKISKEFAKVLEIFKPTHVIFLGGVYNKPSVLYRQCDERNIKRVFIIWNQDFYCQNFYACLENGPCRKCLVDDSFFPDGLVCSRCKGKSVIDKIKLHFRVIQIHKMKKYLISAHSLMGTGTYQRESFELLGVDKKKIVDIPLFFDKSLINEVHEELSDYFVWYGQTRYEKGFECMKQILEAVDERVHVVIPIPSSESPEEIANSLGLKKYVEKGVLRIITGVTWQDGVQEIIANSIGVILPSLWPTTTEYTFLESIGLGKPVLAWNLGVYPDYIIDGENGFIPEVWDVNSMVKDMYSLIDNPGLYSMIADNTKLLFEKITNDDLFIHSLSQVLN